MASARWRTRDRKNSWPVAAAVASTTARRALKSSGTAEADDASPATVKAARGSSLNDPTEFGSWVMRHLQVHELRRETCSVQEGAILGACFECAAPTRYRWAILSAFPVLLARGEGFSM